MSALLLCGKMTAGPVQLPSGAVQLSWLEQRGLSFHIHIWWAGLLMWGTVYLLPGVSVGLSPRLWPLGMSPVGRDSVSHA